MNTIQINKIMEKCKSTKKIYMGTFAIDELPEKVFYPSAMIVNTHPSHKSGEHWLAIYFDKNKKGTFFDSYGNTAKFFNLGKFMKKHSISYKENSVMLQSNSSEYCGIYSILFLIHMSKKLTLKQFLLKFNSPSKNDAMIKEFLKKY